MPLHLTDELNECLDESLNNCWRDANAHCIDQEVGFMCKCDFEYLGVCWNNTAEKCQLPDGGRKCRFQHKVPLSCCTIQDGSYIWPVHNEQNDILFYFRCIQLSNSAFSGNRMVYK